MGLGYIELPTAAMFAAAGLQITGVDVNPHVIAAVNAGRTHIVGPDLEDLVRLAVAEGKPELRVSRGCDGQFNGRAVQAPSAL